MEPAPGGSNDIFIVGLVFFGAVWAIFAIPYVFHVVRAVRAHNAWLPFEAKPNGRYTFMAQNRWFASFRAPQPAARTTFGLVARYAVWAAVVVALAYLPARYLVYVLTH